MSVGTRPSPFVPYWWWYGSGEAAPGTPTDPGCQGHPTVLLTTFDWVAADFDTYPAASCYGWAETAPLWAGEARGLFRFNARAIPARTHGGLASQAAIEARLGRSIPDPTDPEGEVWYWDSYPRVFHVRNSSGETVEARFTRTGGCGTFTQEVLDGTELDIGPFYGDASHVLVQIVGPDPAEGGAPTVPSGVDVKVTAPTIADPGETFDFGCSDPAVSALLDETFEGTGYAEVWSEGETLNGTASLDEDASAPAGAPDWWGDTALRAQVSTGEQAYVTNGFGSDVMTRHWLTFGLYVASHSLAAGEEASLLRGYRSLALGGNTANDLWRCSLLNDGGQLSLRTNVKYETATHHTDDNPIAVETFYIVEILWDNEADVFEVYLDETLVDTLPIGGNVDSEDWGLGAIDLGTYVGTEGDADYYIGRVSLTSERADYLD